MVNSEQISHIVLVFALLNLNKKMANVSGHSSKVPSKTVSNKHKHVKNKDTRPVCKMKAAVHKCSIWNSCYRKSSKNSHVKD